MGADRRKNSTGIRGWRFHRNDSARNQLIPTNRSALTLGSGVPEPAFCGKGARRVRELNRGILIAIEGIDGAGKTTQTRLLAERLANDGFLVATLKEPTEGKWGQRIRNLASHGRNLNPMDEMRLFLKDRQEDVEANIRPSLAEKRIVIMDRYYLSNIAYQGALGLDTEGIRQMNEEFAPVPDLVIILDVAPSIGQSRLLNGRKEKPNHFEGEEYLEKVREQFQRMQHLKNVQLIDGSRPISEVAKSVLNSVRSIIKAVGETNGTEVAEASPSIAGA